jgi:hypothetical protein
MFPVSKSQLIHISSEIILLLSITFFLNRQVKSVKKMVTDTNNRLNSIEQDFNDKLNELNNILVNNQHQLNRYSMMNSREKLYDDSNEQFFNRNQEQQSVLRKRKINIKPRKDENDCKEDGDRCFVNKTYIAKESMKLNSTGSSLLSEKEEIPQQKKNPILNILQNPFDILTMAVGVKDKPRPKADIEILDEEYEEDEENEVDEEQIDNDIKDDLEELLNNKN